MKLNYYMRGLGTGIVVTALLMGIALSGRKEKMTDEQIRQRALEMGMVDGNMVLADMPDNQERDGEDKEEDDNEDSSGTLSHNEIADNGNSATDKPAGDRETENNEEAGNGKPGNGDDIEEETPQEAGEESQETENEEDPEENVIVNEIITITINSGDGSRVVANKLLQAGLVDDAAAYDAFLCQNGYDKRLKTGRHDIPAGASNEEIAAAVTQKGY